MSDENKKSDEEKKAAVLEAWNHYQKVSRENGMVPAVLMFDGLDKLVVYRSGEDVVVGSSAFRDEKDPFNVHFEPQTLLRIIPWLSHAAVECIYAAVADQVHAAQAVEGEDPLVDGGDADE